MSDYFTGARARPVMGRGGPTDRGAIGVEVPSEWVGLDSFTITKRGTCAAYFKWHRGGRFS